MAEHAGNRTLARLLRPLVMRTSLVLLRYGPQDIRDGADTGCDCREHRSILAAIKLRDGAAAGRAMVEHLSRLESQLQFGAPERAAPGLAMLLGLADGAPA